MKRLCFLFAILVADSLNLPALPNSPNFTCDSTVARRETVSVEAQLTRRTPVHSSRGNQLVPLVALMVTFLDKHQPEIIDYRRPQQMGKPVGNGRIEKGVEQVIDAPKKNA